MSKRAGGSVFVGLALLIALAVAASCAPVGEASTPQATGDTDPPEPAALPLAAAMPEGQPPYRLVRCQTSQRAGQPVSIGEDGGTVEIGGHRLDIPPGAVVGEPVRFQMQVVGGQDRRVRIRADGQPSYQFAAPVVLSLSSEACESTEGSFVIVKVVPTEEGDVIEDPDFPSVDDRLNRVVHAQLRTLSGYSIGVR